MLMTEFSMRTDDHINGAPDMAVKICMPSDSVSGVAEHLKVIIITVGC